MAAVTVIECPATAEGVVEELLTTVDSRIFLVQAARTTHLIEEEIADAVIDSLLDVRSATSRIPVSPRPRKKK